MFLYNHAVVFVSGMYKTEGASSYKDGGVAICDTMDRQIFISTCTRAIYIIIVIITRCYWYCAITHSLDEGMHSKGEGP